MIFRSTNPGFFYKKKTACMLADCLWGYDAYGYRSLHHIFIPSFIISLSIPNILSDNRHFRVDRHFFYFKFIIPALIAFKRSFTSESDASKQT